MNEQQVLEGTLGGYTSAKTAKIAKFRSDY